MGGIFISYRREDSAPYARLLSDSLGGYFGPEQIFRDIDTIGPGADFPEAIARAVGSCKVLLAVIGDKWLSTEQDGRRRLDNEGDYVRLEIAAALERDILVVPVLLEQTRMPGRAELPADLAELADRNAVRLTDDGWHDAVRRLAAHLEQPLGMRQVAAAEATPRPRPSGWGPGTPTPSSWTSTPLPEPARGRRRTSVVAGGAVAAAVAVVVGVIVLVGGGGDGGEVVATTTTTAGGAGEEVSTNPSVTLGTVPRPTIGRPSMVIAPRVETDVDVTPTSGPVGTVVTLTGTGFEAGERVDVRFHTTAVGDTRAGAAGEISHRFRIPDTPFTGQQFDVVATGASSIRSARASFRVT